MLHFLITLTTHAPWIYTPQEYGTFSKGKSNRDRLLNAMWYLDQSLKQYYADVPDGTAICIYGDHNSAIFPCGKETATARRVPFIFAVKGTKLSVQHNEIDEMDLSMLDVSSYVRQSIGYSAPNDGARESDVLDLDEIENDESQRYEKENRILK